MDVRLSAKTADGIPIPGASVSLDGGSAQATAQDGTINLSPAGATAFVVTVAMQNYTTQVTSFRLLSGSWQWDDPGTVVSASSGQMSVDVRLGRMNSAPTVPLDDKVLDTPAAILKARQTKTNTSGWDPAYTVPLQHTFTDPNGEYSFLGAYKKQFWSVTTPSIIRGQAGRGWDALSSGNEAIEPPMQGHFRWVEWAPGDGSRTDLNRYLIALWRPASQAISGATTRDVILFYTPNTAFNPPTGVFFPPDSPPYRHNYPYGLVERENVPTRLIQLYMELFYRYAFHEKWIVYQLIAAKRDALLVIPIQPSAHWEVLQTPAGARRLLAEATLYEHRQRVSPDGVGPTLDLAPIANFVRSGQYATYLAPPKLGTVVTAGHSAGMSAITQLVLQTAAGPPSRARTWTDEVQNSYLSDPSDFVTQWLEIWDLDGSQGAVGAVGTWASLLASWQRANGHAPGGQTNRVARCYHCEYTGWNATSVESMRAVVGPPSANAALAAAAAGNKAIERHGTNGSAVWFSYGFLAGNGPPNGWNSTRPGAPDEPDFWSGNDTGPVAHTAVLKICFAHAAANSQLKKL